MRIEELYSLYSDYPKITTDTRKIEKGCIFFALKGERFDGNTFAEKAILEGARIVVIDNAEYKLGSEYILVDNVLNTLQDLARYHIKRLKPALKVIGLTGSNGKTTTKELVAKVLSAQYKTQYTKGNLNNHIGVPLTILDIQKDTEIAVVEMGANHHGEIALLASVAQPEFGLITNIGEAHIEGFGSLEGVLKAKSELFDYILRIGGNLFVNQNDELISKKYLPINYEKKILYGSGPESIVNGKVVESGLEQQVVLLQFGSSKYEFTAQLIGSYNLDNFLAAAAVGKFFGVPEKIIVESLAHYKPNLNRSQFVKTNRNKLLIDAYNANPTSMIAALENFNRLSEKNKILILGGMKELGEDSISHHRHIIEIINSFDFQDVYLVGDEFLQHDQESIKVYNTVSELIEMLKKINIEGATVLIKGSRANQLEKIVEFL